MISLAGTQLPPHLRSVAEYAKVCASFSSMRWPGGCEREFPTVIFPREQMLKNSLPTSAPFFAEWLSRRVTAHRANNFWRPADWQCERGLQDLLTRILKTVQEGRNDRDERD